MDVPITATGLTFSEYRLVFNKKRQSHIIQKYCLVLKYVFYLFFALSSLCSRYSADVCQFAIIHSWVFRVSIFRQNFSRSFLFTAIVNGISLHLCLCDRNQDSNFSIPCDMLHDCIFQKKNCQYSAVSETSEGHSSYSYPEGLGCTWIFKVLAF